MNTLDERTNTVMTADPAAGVRFDEPIIAFHRKRSRGKLLLIGGILGVIGVAFIAFAPEWGITSALGGIAAGAGSAVVTIFARR